jgi:hypothetical protein
VTRDRGEEVSALLDTRIAKKMKRLKAKGKCVEEVAMVFGSLPAGMMIMVFITTTT